jgi:hypothetical protein
MEKDIIPGRQIRKLARFLLPLYFRGEVIAAERKFLILALCIG